jgi:hypothetical protein
MKEPACKTDKIDIKNARKKKTNEIIIKIKACIRYKCDAVFVIIKRPDLHQLVLGFV